MSRNVLDLFKPVFSSVKEVVESKGEIPDTEIVFTVIILPVPLLPLEVILIVGISLWDDILFLCQLLVSITSS